MLEKSMRLITSIASSNLLVRRNASGYHNIMTSFSPFMSLALDLAKRAQDAGEVPVGAVVVKDGDVIGKGENRTRRDNDPTAHAEVIAIRSAALALGNFRLENCDLYVTLEPCAMCAGAIAEARIERLYFGADDPKSGGTFHGAKVFSHPQCHHKPDIYDGIAEQDARALLEAFFKARR